MFYQELSNLTDKYPYANREIEALDRYLSSLGEANRELYLSFVVKVVESQPRVVQRLLDELVVAGLFEKKYRVICPQGEAGIEDFDRRDEIPREIECDFCEEEHPVKDGDVAEFFVLNKFNPYATSSNSSDFISEMDKLSAEHRNSHEIPHDNVITSLDEMNPFDGLPLLHIYSNEKAQGDVSLKDYQFIFIVHFLRDIYGFLKAFEKVGVNPRNSILIHKNYPYKYLDDTKSNLRSLGYKVFSLDEKERAIEEALSAAKLNTRRIVVVEDGGYLVPLFHTKYMQDISVLHGAVEQTTKGIRRDKEIEKLKFPVLSVAESEIKSKFEAPAVAEAAVRNIRTLLENKRFEGQPALVIGYGTIGKQIAERMKNAERMLVSVFDRDPERLAEAQRDGFETDTHLPNLIRKAWLIVGATGNMSIGEEEISHLQQDVVLVSASSDREEIGVEALEVLSSDKQEIDIGIRYRLVKQEKVVTLLGNGYPINFVGSESIPNEIIDLILTELYLASIVLAGRNNLHHSAIHTDLVDEVMEQEKLIERYYRQHQR